MILSESYTSDWIKAKRKIYTKSDPSIMEKVIYAFSLVEHLVRFDLRYTFKGGTSLLLILPEPKRFSVDVDIITTESREKIESILELICREGVFLRYELDEYRSYKPGIPKAHYQLTFYSQWENIEKSILLDILFEEHGYPAVVSTPIVNEWIKTDGTPLMVSVPTVDSIAGDKITAYAPNTTGIKYKVEYADGGVREKQMEVMKQLFDIGILFDRLSNLDHFKQSFTTTSKKEIAYRSELAITQSDVLNDIINTSLIVASLGKFFDPNNDYSHIKTGLSQLKSYIYNGSFRSDDAILASSKAAYLAAIILKNYEGNIKRWQSVDNIKNYFIEPVAYQFLNKRKNIPGAPLFYWHHCLKLLGKI